MNHGENTLKRLNPDPPTDGTQCSPPRDAACEVPISINPNQKSTKPNSNYDLLASYIQALFMATVISLFFVFVGILIILVHILVAGPVILHRKRHRRTTTRLPNFLELEDINLEYIFGVGCGLSRSNLQKFSNFNYLIEPDSTQDCSVCLEDFREGQRCRMLPKCKHAFHANCIDSWLIRVPVCPICRQEVVIPKIDRLLVGSNEAYSS